MFIFFSGRKPRIDPYRRRCGPFRQDDKRAGDGPAPHQGDAWLHCLERGEVREGRCPGDQGPGPGKP